jgi:Ca2+-binding EF-hand superfamily protein
LNALVDFKIDIKQEKAKNVFEGLDVDSSGLISFDEFLDGVVGALTPLRKRLIEEAFEHLDKDGSKKLELREVKEMFQGARHPECISGEKSAE